MPKWARVILFSFSGAPFPLQKRENKNCRFTLNSLWNLASQLTNSLNYSILLWALISILSIWSAMRLGLIDKTSTKYCWVLRCYKKFLRRAKNNSIWMIAQKVNLIRISELSLSRDQVTPLNFLQILFILHLLNMNKRIFLKLLMPFFHMLPWVYGSQ